MGKKKSGARAAPKAATGPKSEAVVANGADQLQAAVESVPNGVHKVEANGAAVDVAAVEAQVATLRRELEATAEELAAARSAAKDSQVRAARAEEEAAAAKAEAAADRHVAELALASATTAKRVNYLLGATSLVCAVAAAAALLRGGRA